MSNGFWTGTRLVAGRSIREAWASKSWRLITLLLLLIGLAVIVVPRLLGDSEDTRTLAVVGQPGPVLAGQLRTAAAAAGFEAVIEPAADDAAAEQAVRDGAAHAGLGGTPQQPVLYTPADSPGATFTALVAQAVAAQSAADALAAAALTPEQAASLASYQPPREVPVGDQVQSGRAGVGFAMGIVLYIALILTGTGIATAVATEKSTRISEVLLAVVRPVQLLVGTVLGTGLLGLFQVAVLAVPAALGIATSDSLGLPGAAVSDVALAVLWFVVGLALYAFVFAALGALVDKPTEVGGATAPANIVLIGSYLLAVTVVVSDPMSWVATAASLFPLSSPLVMPVRWSSGLVPVWQLVLALALALAAAALLAVVGARIYRRGITRTGRRLKLREVLTG